MNKYDPKSIEPKWQKFWEDNQTFRVETDPSKEKFFGLIEFPYPSGAGLHVGHPRSYTAMDVITRQKRMEGKNVLYPIGFDSFGLPTENFAIKTGRPPAEITDENIANFTRQLKTLGFGFDWSRAVTTSEPEYYKWTQWIFLQLYKHGLAYKANQPINWCPKDKIGLANEEVVDGNCERCGSPVEKRNKEQWMLAITKYADKLLAGLNEVDYITRAKIQQENWIGRSEGVNLRFKIENSEKVIEVFTTRLDTIFSGTFIVLAPENPLVLELTTPENKAAVEDYIKETAQKTDIERTDISKEKTGVFIGSYAINPATDDKMPIWISDFVLAQYGTGVVFADAHDERDFEMAKKFNIPLKVSLRTADDEQWERVKNLEECFSGEGVLVNSGQFDGLQSAEAREKICEWLATKGMAEKKIQFKLRDWVFSRQRYWGEPIPLVFCENCAKSDNQNGQIVELKKASAWNRLVSGTKTAKGFAFGNKQTPVEFKAGDTLTFVHDDETRSAEITKVHDFKSLAELASATELHGKLFDTAVPLTEAELAKLYTEYNSNYPEYIAESGLVVCEFALQPKKYKGNRGWIPLPESELPLELPKVEKYLPTDTGESPLAAMTDWVKTTCPKCGGEARRETDTMPNWAGSSWYFLRYMDPKNAKDLFTANGFKFRPAIEPTEKDRTYFATFKQVYQDLEKQNIKVWAGNRLLLNGLNRNLWTELRTVCLLAWNDDKAAIANYLLEQGYTLTQSFNQNDLYEKAGVRVEIVPVWKENGEMYSLTYQGAKQPMQARDLPEVLMGHLWGFSFRIISPEYNLAHYEYTEKHEPDSQSNQEKIAFLSEWVEKINPNIRYWNQVDWYNGGMEHTVLHLLYSRFWNQFLYDIGVVPTLEPYKKRTSHGMILAKGGEKMSKSKGNVVNPDEMVELYGADALRTYIMFMGPFDQAVEWDTNGLVGVRRFLDKVWNLQEKVTDNAVTNKKVVTQLHQVIKKVTDDIANMSFNTSVAKLMELANTMSTEEQIAKTDYQIFIKLVSVFAPHIGEELWSMFGDGNSVSKSSWPLFDAELAKDSEVTVAVQVNGKVRAELVVSPEIAEEEIKSLALANENIQKWLDGKEPKKVIYVKGRLVSIVV